MLKASAYSRSPVRRSSPGRSLGRAGRGRKAPAAAGQEVSPIDTLLTIILVIFLIFLILGGVGLYFAIKLGRAAARKAREASSKIAAHVNAMGTGEAAEVERMRVGLRREISLTRQALDQATARGWHVGELPALVREMAEHADVLDAQLEMYARQNRATGVTDHVTLERLRNHHAKLTTSCARIRADLLDNQVSQSSSSIEDLRTRTEIELEARRAAPDPLDEIDSLYRRALGQNRSPEDPA